MNDKAPDDLTFAEWQHLWYLFAAKTDKVGEERKRINLFLHRKCFEANQKEKGTKS